MAMGEKALTDEEKLDVAMLWDTYFDDPNLENCNRLIEHYLYLVKKVVLLMSPYYRTVFRDYDDLISSGIFGLMDAIQKCDPKQVDKFENYAHKRINGEVHDYMRRQDWLPYKMRHEMKLVKKTYEEMACELNRSPLYEEIAERLNMPVSKVEKMLWNDRQYYIVHFEDIVRGITFQTRIEEGDIHPFVEEHTEWMPGNTLLEQEARDTLAGYIGELSKNEQLVLDLYYTKELTLREIGVAMGYTEARISQIHKCAIEKLSAKYSEGQEDEKR